MTAKSVSRKSPWGTKKEDPNPDPLHVGAPWMYRGCTAWQHRKAVFWGRLCSFVEAKWLESNGWRQMPDGFWDLPEWHPKKEKGETYDQNHAANSQRAHTQRGKIQWRDQRKSRVPLPSASIKVLPRIFLLCGVLATCSGFMLRGPSDWVFWVAFPVQLATLGYMFYLVHSLKKELEFEHLEKQLRGSHGSGGGRAGGSRDRARRR